MTSPATLLVFVSMFTADPAGGIQAFHLDPATDPEGRVLLVAHYTGGTVAALPLAADLGCDAIFVYRLEDGRLVPHEPARVATRPGAGPRHLAFHPDGRRLYAVNELDNTVAWYDFDALTGRLVERQVIPTLPAGFSGATKTADLAITPDGRFLYATNRGHDSVAAYAIGADGRLTALGESVKVAKPSAIAIIP